MRDFAIRATAWAALMVLAYMLCLLVAAFVAWGAPPFWFGEWSWIGRLLFVAFGLYLAKVAAETD